MITVVTEVAVTFGPYSTVALPVPVLSYGCRGRTLLCHELTRHATVSMRYVYDGCLSPDHVDNNIK